MGERSEDWGGQNVVKVHVFKGLGDASDAISITRWPGSCRDFNLQAGDFNRPRNNKLLGTSASLLVTSAVLVVTRS